jgi:hypothetical protein
MVVVLATGCDGKEKSVSAAPVNLVGQPGAAQATPIPEVGGIGDRRESELVGVTLISVRRMSEIYGREPVNFMADASDFIVLDLLFDYKGIFTYIHPMEEYMFPVRKQAPMKRVR